MFGIPPPAIVQDTPTLQDSDSAATPAAATATVSSDPVSLEEN